MSQIVSLQPKLIRWYIAVGLLLEEEGKYSILLNRGVTLSGVVTCTQSNKERNARGKIDWIKPHGQNSRQPRRATISLF
jgi:hypothetical protein